MRKGISELIAVQSFLPVVGESSVWSALEAFLAIEKLMDQALLADFAKNDKQADVRGATGGAPPQPNDTHAWLRRQEYGPYVQRRGIPEGPLPTNV